MLFISFHNFFPFFFLFFSCFFHQILGLSELLFRYCLIYVQRFCYALHFCHLWYSHFLISTLMLFCGLFTLYFWFFEFSEHLHNCVTEVIFWEFTKPVDIDQAFWLLFSFIKLGGLLCILTITFSVLLLAWY